MDIADAQREMRSVYIGGFWGQLVSSVIWLASAAVGTWVSPKASILTVVIGGFFIFLLTQMLLRLSGRRARVSKESTFHSLGMQVDCWSRSRAHGGWSGMGSTRYADGKRSRSSSAWKRHTT